MSLYSRINLVNKRILACVAIAALLLSMIPLHVASAAADESAPVRPIFECYVDNGDDTGTAYFGFLNENEETVHVPVGSENQVTGVAGSPDAGQPTSFAPGRTGYVDNAGVFHPEYAAFSADFPLSGNVVWSLQGRTATAGTNGAECPAVEEEEEEEVEEVYIEHINVCKYVNDESIAGWDITLTSENSEVTPTGTTGTDGCVAIEFDWLAGPWDVQEEVREDHEQVSVETESGVMQVLPSGETADAPDMCHIEAFSPRARVAFIDLDDGGSETEMPSSTIVPASFDCTFYNRTTEVTSTPRRPSSGTLIRSRADAPTPAVLGAATSTEAISATTQCTRYLNDYLQLGDDNSTWEVLKLQLFLASQAFFTMNVGVFDAATEAAVRAYQANNPETTLQPWVDAGIVTELAPTGRVYKTTRYSINNTLCPGSEAMPELP